MIGISKCIQNKKPLFTTRQGPNLHKLLTNAKFELNILGEPIMIKPKGLLTCNDDRRTLQSIITPFKCLYFPIKAFIENKKQAQVKYTGSFHRTILNK